MEKQYYYDEIMALYGLEEMKRVIQKWDAVSNNIEQSNDMPIVLPNLFWVTKSGIGKSHFIRLLSNYLSATKLMSFFGTVKYIEFSLDHCPDDRDFSDLRRLMRELDAATRYRGVYKGVLSIELNQWRAHFNSLHFKRLMTFLSSQDNALCILFVLENVSDQDANELEHVLAQYVRIEKVTSEYPCAEALFAYVENWLSNYDFSLTSGAKILLKDSVDFLRSGHNFDGFKTLNLMCEDIVFEICASQAVTPNRVISEVDLNAYSKDGVFVRRLKERAPQKTIGFLPKEGGAL